MVAIISSFRNTFKNNKKSDTDELDAEELFNKLQADTKHVVDQIQQTFLTPILRINLDDCAATEKQLQETLLSTAAPIKKPRF